MGQPISLFDDETEYMQKKVGPPNVIIDRAEFPILCAISTLYRLFRQGLFDLTALTMKGKKKAYGYKKRDRQAFKRTILQCNKDYQFFNNELFQLEGETIVRKDYQK